jgi:hypothetical protein
MATAFPARTAPTEEDEQLGRMLQRVCTAVFEGRLAFSPAQRKVLASVLRMPGGSLTAHATTRA